MDVCAAAELVQRSTYHLTIYANDINGILHREVHEAAKISLFLWLLLLMFFGTGGTPHNSSVSISHTNLLLVYFLA